MVHRLLAAQYRSLANAFAEEQLPVETLSCLTAALELDRAAGQDTVRRLLGLLGELDFDPRPSKPSPKRLRLIRRKRKVDEMLARERKITESVETPDAAPPLGISDQSIPTEMLHRLARVEVRLSGIDGSRFEKAHRRLKRLLDRCCPAGWPTLDRPTGPDKTDGALAIEFVDTLSVEHELHNLANDFYHLERYDEAIQCYDIAISINRDLLETWFNRGLAHTKERHYEPAERDMSKVIEMNPNLPEAWYTRGLIREYQEQYDEAITDYEKALEVDPGYNKAKEQRTAAQRKLDDSRTRRRGPTSDSDDSEGRIRDFSPYLTTPDSTLADVGGHREVKRRMRSIVAYLRGDEILTEWGAELPRGVLLCGRPGVGKTHLARCLAGEAQCPFYTPPTSVFEDMWAGNMQKNLRQLWQQASQHPRAIIFLDEFDSLGSRRSGARDSDSWYNRMVGCILELMDNLARRSERIVVVAATNRKANIDPAFLRPGRFTYVIEVESPTAMELAEIWSIHLEAAASRAKRVDFLTDTLTEAVLADRPERLEKAFRSPEVDPSGLVRLAQLSTEKDLVGDDVREVIRRAIDERVMAALDCGVDLGPLGPDDLYRQLEDYEPEREDEEDDA
ncbi:MAG: AAA family ATPase [Planctomycetota bacterium]